MPKIRAIIFARLNSSRLPGKVLFKLGDKTILEIIISKLKQIGSIDVVVATSIEDTDKPITDLCKEIGVDVFRGDLDNVSLRTYNCLRAFQCDAFFRINADSPFLQRNLILKAITTWGNESDLDIITNTFTRSYPYGVAVELMRSETFFNNIQHFNSIEREHILSYFYSNFANFKIKQLVHTQDLSGERFVLDTKEDWEQLQRLYNFDKNIFNYTLDELLNIKNNEEYLFN